MAISLEILAAVVSVMVALSLPVMAVISQRNEEAKARSKFIEDARAAEEARRKAQEAARIAAEKAEQEAKRKLRSLSPRIKQLYDEVVRVSSFESGYLMKKDWDSMLRYAAPTLKALAEIPDSVIRASTLWGQVAFIRERCLNQSFRVKRNNDYKEHELRLCNALLSNIDGGKSLDLQQRDAIVTDEYSNLVIAGAGSGKTSVVVGKVRYLVEHWGIEPSQILVTSFTRASVDDLKARIEASGVRDVSVRTFHSLGLDVLGDGFAVANENALERHVTSYFSKKLAADSRQAAAFLEFFGLRSLVQGDSPDSKVSEVRMKLLKAQDMRTLKGFVEESRRQPGMDTLHGERVKSLEELMIANFLFLNGVAYEYEGVYPYDIPEELSGGGHRAYQPDFYLVDYDVWLEHFGVDRRGRVPWIEDPIEERRYIDGMNWKRQVHAACGTKLIESYSWWNSDQDLLNRLEKLLVSNGVILVNDPKRNAAICGDLLRDQRFFSSMTQLVSTFISLVKSGNRTEAEVDDKARSIYRGNGAMWHRYDLFTRFAWPIMRSYQKTLAGGKKPKVDFDDMINMAAERIRKYGYKNTYRYIIVDEYQDISLSRLGLLSAIRDATGAKLMCVGDDWQAIYRFAGSDVTLFTNFGKLVGYHEEMRIECTYRNSQALVDAASRFVLKNPDQLRKTVRSMASAQGRPPIAVVSLRDQRAAFTFALNDLLSSGDGGGEIKVLGRNKHDLERIFPGFEPVGNINFRNPKRNSAKEAKFEKVIVCQSASAPPREIGYMTVHKSKGLQADNTIVIGLVNERYGFPNMMADDPILELLLADSDRYDFAEERRLFYVALTRTKNRVWLVTGEDSGNPGISRFVDELCADNATNGSLVLYKQEEADDVARCPRCGGVLLRREVSGNAFVGCSNYPFCDKTYSDVRILLDKKKCPVCGGWLTRRRNLSDGHEFYGCTNWPYCSFTMNLDGTGGSAGKAPSSSRLSGNTPATRVSMEYSSPGARDSTLDSRSASVARDATSYTVSFEFDRSQTAAASDAGRNAKHSRKTTTSAVNRDYGSSRSVAHGESGSTTDARPKCPKCGAPMERILGAYGPVYRCVNYPRCDGLRSCVESTRTGW